MAEEDDDCYYYTLPPSLACSPLLKPTSSGCHGGDRVMELLWQNGQAVMQGKRSHKKKSDDDDDHHHHPVDWIPSVVAGGSPPLRLNHDDPLLHPQQHNDIANNNLFIQEDEMATWLLSNFGSDLLLPSSSTSPTATAPAPFAIASHPTCPPPAVPLPRRFESFGHFSRLNRPIAIEATVVDSSDTPMVARVSDNTAGCDVARVSAESISEGVRDAATCDLTLTSSSGASSESTEPIPPVKSHKAAPPLPSPRKTTADDPEERKRKARDGCGRLNSAEDGEKLERGSSSTKRSRAAEVHNLSERRRRDRINEKMRALQELIPHCHKADKASMLDEAIEYLKSLQMQVQMMSMGCGMMPMMYPYPGVRQYVPPMDMGMGIGIGMEMRMNQPIMQFPRVFPCSNLLTGGAGPPMCPRFRFPAFQIPPHIPSPNPWRVPPSNQPGSVLSSVPAQNQPRIPGFVDPYLQFLGLQHLQSNTSSGGMATTSKAGENSQQASPD